MPYTFLAAAEAYGTTPGVDSTGATMMFVAVGWHTAMGVGDITDNKGNTITIVESSDADAAVSLGFCENPIVGTGHTVTAASGVQGGVVALFVSGGSNSAHQDSSANSSTSNVTSQQPGALTASATNQIAVAAMGMRPSLGNSDEASFAVDSSFTLAGTLSTLGTGPTAPKYGVALAYLIDPALSAINPTFSWTGANAAAAAMSIFGEPPDDSGEIKTIYTLNIPDDDDIKTIMGVAIASVKTYNGFRP